MNSFTNKHIRKEVVKGNIVHYFLYLSALPLSKLFIKLKVTPNAITFASILTAILAFVSLIIDDGYIYFCIFWVISFHLDFCDGTVARMTGKVNKTAFRFDHMSDIFKICLIFLGAGIHYNIFTIWILSVIATFTFLYVTIFNHDLESYEKLKGTIVKTDKSQDCSNTSKMASLKNRAQKSAIILNLVTFFVSLNGHTLLFFLMIPFGILQTKIFFIYFILLTISRTIKVIAKLLRLPKIKSIK